MDNYERLEGKATAVLFSNESNGYTVLKLDCGVTEPVTVVGCLPYAAPGEYFELYGSWTEHRTYGQQFKAAGGERWLPQAPEDIEAYLGSGVLRGIGAATAARIVSRFGERTFSVLSEEPERLALIQGITPEKARKIQHQFNERMELRRLLEFVSEHGLSPETGMRLFRRHGALAASMVTNNPYVLVDAYYGVSFPMADLFARDLGLADDSPMRFDAAVKYVLIHNLSNGHVFIPAGKLCNAAAALLELPDPADMESALSRLCDRGEIVREPVLKEDACYLSALYEAETGVARRLSEMTARQPFPLPPDAVDFAERDAGITYGEKQREAIRGGASLPVMILTGGPGTGKTTAIRAIIRLCQRMDRKVTLAAPTGRAANRMSDVCGMEARTIHRLLETVFSEDKSSQEFGRNEENPIDTDVLIVDELSMVDLPLLYALLRALPEEASLILIGDADQLPSVGPGNVLKDLIQSECIPTVHLDTIFRQAQESMIIMNAHAINEGRVPELRSDRDFFYMKRGDGHGIAETIVELCAVRLPKFFHLDPSQIQVIAPSKKQEAGTANLNRRLQEALNPAAPGKAELRMGEGVLRQGDRVMQMRNNYDVICQKPDTGETSFGVFNGDTATVTAIDTAAQILTLTFDDGRMAAYTPELLPELDLAYAITVHKSQGNEFPVVVLSVFDADPRLLSRNLLYTAVTRARNQLVVVGSDEVFARMVANNIRHKRYSALHVRLRRIRDEQ